VKIKFEYKPKQMNTNGPIPNMLNHVRVEDVSVDLQKLKHKDVKGWKALQNNILTLYKPLIYSQLPLSYITGIYYIHSLYTIGSGFTDLIFIPYNEYKEEGIVKGIAKGTISFLKKLTKGGSEIAARMMVSTTSFLQYMVGEVGETSKFSNQPSNTMEGFYQAYDSFSFQIKHAKENIIIMPMKEYEKFGPAGYVTSFFKAVPIAIVAPVIGTTDGLSRVILGINRHLLHDQEEKNDKYG